MELVGGPPGVAAIAGVAFLLVVLAVLHFRYRIFRRRKGRGRGKSAALSHGRVEVLETKVIDANRKLVLMRCDDIEHLVMVGGPADVVVENDVRKVRGPGAPPAKIPGFETERRAPSGRRLLRRRRSIRAIAAAPKAPEPRRPAVDARQTPVRVARSGCSAAARPRRHEKRRRRIRRRLRTTQSRAPTQRPARTRRRPARADAASPRAGRTEPTAAEPAPFRSAAGERRQDRQGRTGAPSRARRCRPRRSPGRTRTRSRTRSCGRSASTRRRAADAAGIGPARACAGKAGDGFIRHPRRSRRPAGGSAGARDAVGRSGAETGTRSGRFFVRHRGGRPAERAAAPAAPKERERSERRDPERTERRERSERGNLSGPRWPPRPSRKRDANRRHSPSAARRRRSSA